MAGGFAESPYLNKEIESLLAKRGDIKLRKVSDWYVFTFGESLQCADNHSWTSVVKGAVLSGAGMGTSIPLPVEMCPRRYGVCINERFADHKHTGTASTDPLDGSYIAAEQFNWVIQKGEILPSAKNLEKTTQVRLRFRKIGDEAGITFVASGSDDIPRSTSQLKPSKFLIFQLRLVLI